MKLISHLLILMVGAGLGIWWGVNHPEAAQNVAANEEQQAAKIQAAVSQEKIKLLNQFAGKGARIRTARNSSRC